MCDCEQCNIVMPEEPTTLTNKQMIITHELLNMQISLINNDQ